MRAELPYLASGGIIIIGATVRDGKLPELTGPLLGTITMVIFASALDDTKFAPAVRAFGILLLIGAVIAAGTAISHKRTKVVK